MIGIYIVTKNMTVEQHTKGRDRLREAGAPEGAMKLHSCFGEDGKLQVFDVWESQEAFDEFLKYLGPVMEELGIELAQPPTIMPIVDLVGAGIIDPAMVTRSALQNAASIAKNILTTEAIVAEIPEKETAGPGGMPDMGGMM